MTDDPPYRGRSMIDRTYVQLNNVRVTYGLTILHTYLRPPLRGPTSQTYLHSYDPLPAQLLEGTCLEEGTREGSAPFLLR